MEIVAVSGGNLKMTLIELFKINRYGRHINVSLFWSCKTNGDFASLYSLNSTQIYL